jgi:diketogulonate reductase-like aldo/keto reductase
VGAGVAQVIFRFAQQVGMLPLTGTTNPQHMKEDLAVRALHLTPEELQSRDDRLGNAHDVAAGSESFA